MLSAKRNITWINSGLKPTFIKVGTQVDAKIVHLLTVFGKRIVAIAVPKKNINKSGIPVNLQLLIKLPIKAVTTVPILVFLNTLIKIDDSNIRIIVIVF